METATLSENMQAVDIPLSDIYSDSEFNIRGEIRMPDVVDLARNIDSLGLQQPIAVMPYDKDGYKYRIVLGHRRFAAFTYLRRPTIPAIIKHGLTEEEALALNFTENINRKDLTILQEAHGLQRFSNMGMSNDAIGKRFNKGGNWVKLRLGLLKMPESIQQDVEAGYITQGQLLDLTFIHDPQEQEAIVKKLKEAKFRAEKRPIKIVEKKKDPTKMKKRNPAEMMDMIDHILDEMKVSNPFSRTLAWCMGEINDLDLYREMIEYCEENDIPYDPPYEVQKLLQVNKP